MKAITVKAPYGSLIAAGTKTIETRSRRSPWSSAIGETIAVHQGLQWDTGWLRWHDPDDWRINALDELNVSLDEDVNGSGYYRPHRRDLPLGAIVATAMLVDVVPIMGNCGTDMGQPTHVCVNGYALLHRPEWDPFDGETEFDVTNQLPYGNYESGNWALLFDNVQKVAPVPCRGRQGLWTVPPEIADNLLGWSA